MVRSAPSLSWPVLFLELKLLYLTIRSKDAEREWLLPAADIARGSS